MTARFGAFQCPPMEVWDRADGFRSLDMRNRDVRSDELTSAAQASGGEKHLWDYVFFNASAAIGHEQAQSLARIAISLFMISILLIGKLLFKSQLEWALIFMVVIYSCLSWIYYKIVCKTRGRYLWRRYLSIIADLGITSYSLYRLGLTGLALYPLYLWIVIGNGLRFGTHYLIAAMLFAVSGYLMASAVSGILFSHAIIVLSLLLGMILMPKFFLVMVRRLADINQALQEKNKENEYSATHDSLTGLPNRYLFNDRLAHALQKASRDGKQVAVIFLDLDAFKSINDNFGHDIGDALLICIARCITNSLRSSDLVARLGGDEFVVLLESCSSSAEISAVVEQIFQCSGKYYDFDQYHRYVTWSCGVAIYPQDGEDSMTLLKHADTAMYEAKSAGTNQFRMYSGDMTREVKRQLKIRDELRQSIADCDFVVHYQPLVEVRSGRILGAEALVRWQHPDRGLLLPGEFVELAEQTGLIVPIGEQVLATAMKDLATWRRQGFEHLRIHVNFSARQLVSEDFLSKMKRIVYGAGLPWDVLDVEITESALIEDEAQMQLLFLKLQRLSVSISLDDFGTGYSSLSYLKLFRLNRIKIDRSFICDIPQDSSDCALVEAMLAIGQRLKLQVVAEGVETADQAEWLMEKGCCAMQGFHFSPPVVADRFLLLLKRGPMSPA